MIRADAGGENSEAPLTLARDQRLRLETATAAKERRSV